MFSFSRAQAGLEYLMTYGWALVLIVTVASVLFFVFTPSAGERVNFSLSNNRQILFKSGNVASGCTANSGELLLQNASGGQIILTKIEASGSFSVVTGITRINGSVLTNPITILAGQTIKITGINVAQGTTSGNIILTYTDKDNYPKTAKIQGNGKCGTGTTTGESSTAVLVGYWKADGDATDSSGTGNNGTWFGTVAYQPGVSGQAFDFPGTSETGIAVADSSSLDLTTGITLAAWVNRRSFSKHYKVVTKPYDMLNTDPWELYALDFKCTSSPGCPCFLISDGIPTGSGGQHVQACATSSAPLNEWHHIAGTYDKTIIKVYSDGQLVGTEPANITIGTNNEAFYINGVQGQAFHINGLTDELKVYNGALTNAEICVVCNEFKPAGATCNC